MNEGYSNLSIVYYNAQSVILKHNELCICCPDIVCIVYLALLRYFGYGGGVLMYAHSYLSVEEVPVMPTVVILKFLQYRLATMTIPKPVSHYFAVHLVHLLDWGKPE